MIGIDYYRTITVNPKLFKRVSGALMAAGYPVYIITAVRPQNVSGVRESVKKSKVPHTQLEVVVFEEFDEIPQLKLEACKRLGVKMMYDDLPGVCELLAKHGIVTCQIRG